MNRIKHIQGCGCNRYHVDGTSGFLDGIGTAFKSIGQSGLFQNLAKAGLAVGTAVLTSKLSGSGTATATAGYSSPTPQQYQQPVIIQQVPAQPQQNGMNSTNTILLVSAVALGAILLVSRKGK